MKNDFLLFLLALSIVLSGCTARSQQRVATYVEQGRDSINQNTNASYAIARVLAESPEQRSIVDSYETNFQTFVASQQAEFALLRKEIEEERQRRIELINALAGIAVSALPGGNSITAVVQALGKHITNTGMQGVQAAEEVAKKQEEFVKQLEELKQQIRQILDRMAADKTLDQLQKEMEDKIRLMCEEKQKQLHAGLVQRVEAMTKQQKAEFAAEFKSQLVQVAAENGMAQQEIDKLKETGADDLLQSYGLGGAGGLIGLFALIRTFGKSRSKEEVDEIWDQVKSLEKDVAVTKTTAAVKASVNA